MSDLSILWLNCNIEKFEHVEWVRCLFLPYADHVDHIGLVCHRPHSATYWPCWPSSTSPSSPLLPSPSACHSCQRIGRFMIWASNDDAFEWQFSWCLTLISIILMILSLQKGLGAPAALPLDDAFHPDVSHWIHLVAVTFIYFHFLILFDFDVLSGLFWLPLFPQKN